MQHCRKSEDTHNGLYGCTQHIHTILLQHTTLIEFYATVKCSLSSESQQNTIRHLWHTGRW